MLRAGIASNVLGVICVVVALVKRDDVAVEGAYFNRSVGSPASAFAVDQPDIVPWLVAAVCLTLVGTALLVARRR
jgi:hypothetical protein